MKNPWIITSLHPKAAGEKEMDACRVYEATFAVNSPTKPCHETKTSRVMGWRLADVFVRVGIMPSILDFMWAAAVGWGWLTCRGVSCCSACERSSQRKVFLLAFGWQHRSRLTVALQVYHGSKVDMQNTMLEYQRDFLFHCCKPAQNAAAEVTETEVQIICYIFNIGLGKPGSSLLMLLLWLT